MCRRWSCFSTKSPRRITRWGAKGIGEAGGLGTAPAVVNGILDALAPLGVTHIDMPATPHRVWQAIRQGQGADRTASAETGHA